MNKERLMAIVKEADKGCAPYYGVIPSLIMERKYRKGIEIGVFVGGHAEAMLNTNLHRLVGIDPYKMYEQPMQRITSQEDFDAIYFFTVNRLQSDRYLHLRMTSDEAYPYLADDKFDFVFIDGLHTYEQVKKELNNYGELIRVGGVIACHDYKHPSFPDLTKAIDEYAKLHKTKVIEGPMHLIYMNKTW
jgi:predicted O-methyltransferase YrrM